MARTITIAAKYPHGYAGPVLPPVDEVLAAGATWFRVGRRHGLRFPPPDDDVTIVDRERLTLAKVKQIREAWTRLTLRDIGKPGA